MNLFITHDNATVVELMPRGVDIPIYNRLARSAADSCVSLT